MKKYIPLLLLALIFSAFRTNAQATHEVRGTVIDTTKQTIIGGIVKLTSDKGDSVNTATDVNGKFVFATVKGTKVTVTVKSIGYTTIIKHFVLDGSNAIANVGVIIMRPSSTTLNEVKIVGVNPVQVKEDTVQYSIAALNLRANATLEDALKKAPGVDVDPSTGAITAQGQSVTKVRINGKDYMGGDVTSLTKNIPADLLESAQIIDDYGDQANLTGIKTGDPTKILNINIRKDRNYGSSVQLTAGEGRDALPSPQTNANRYLGSLNLYNFKGDRQITLLGNVNNTNVSLFSFGSTGNNGGGFGGGGAGGNFGGGGGGGRGNAARGGGSGLTTNQNGITNAHSVGFNYRDQWGKHVAVYGSYSFQDNTTFTQSTSQQKNTSAFPSNTNQNSVETDNNINHRFNFNLEWRPDSVNYLKVTPSFTYAKVLTNSADDVLNQLTSRTTGGLYTNSAYNSTTVANSTSPSYGLNTLYFHSFKKKGRNFSINLALNSSKTDQSQNPIYMYTAGTPLAPLNQVVNTNSTTKTAGATFSYIEPIGKISYLELNYAYNHSYTSSDKITDTLTNAGMYNLYPRLSNEYNYTFTTNRVGLNYRVVDKKYNLTVGAGIQPNTLDGNSVTTNTSTHVTTLNFSPQARFVYNFARSNSLSFNYNGTSNQPSFNQLQPVIDYSNALYPVQGNPNLKPSYSNAFSLRYNKFSFTTGDVLFTNVNFTQTDNNVSTNVITVPKSAALAASPTYRTLQNTILTQYVNTNGYYQGSANVIFSKPWDNRRYTLSLSANASYTNNVGYVSSVDSITTALTSQKNIAKNLNFTPGVRFRLDLTDVVDVQVLTQYGINKTDNSVNSALLSGASNVKDFRLGLNGKNYFWKNWTLSYDFTRDVYTGYTIPVKNPNIFNAYVERRFLKNNSATIRAAVFDILNQNTGFSSSTTATSITQTNTNKLGRYYLLTFTYRLQKFSGRNTGQQNPDGRRRDGGDRGPGGDRGLGGPPGGGMGGPPPGGPGIE